MQAYKKYGVTLKDDDQPLDIWLTHIQEELMDAVNYIEKAKEVFSNEIDSTILNSIDVRDEEKI